ncbi:glycosyltransferase family 4 protein [Chryseobacterium sp.]|uniref:glycosyltransferase family 4 protein n=1 Tax=Chryseobacterium sp. TaxID=1871047 RepID=UPI0038907026
MKKEILIDVERLKYPKSGIANVCFALMKGLDKDFNAFSYTFYGPTVNMPPSTFGFQQVEWKIWQKIFPINLSKFALVHVTHQLSDYFHQVKNGQKKIVTLHDLNFLHDHSSPQKMQKSKRLVQKNIGNADAIVCISQFVKDDFIKNKHLFQLKENVKIEVIHNGLIFPETKKFTSEQKYEFIDKKYILSIGVLFSKKNQMVLLDLIQQTDRDLVLVSASSKSDYKDQFLAKVKELGLEKRVHIVENANQNEKFFLLQNCESYAHPSLAEGFGIPPVEAMYFGKPIFLSTFTSLPEIGGDVAFYFPDFSSNGLKETYQNGMSAFNQNKFEYETRLKQRALQFGHEKMAESYEKLYQEILA